MPKRCKTFKNSSQMTYWVPDEVWSQVSPLIPKIKRGVHGGNKKKVPSRIILGAIFWIVWSEEPWDSLDSKYGCSSSVAYKRYTEWKKTGLFSKISQLDIQLDERVFGGGVNWEWLKLIERFIIDRPNQRTDIETIIDGLITDKEIDRPTPKTFNDFLTSIPTLERTREIIRHFNEIKEFKEFMSPELNDWALRQLSIFQKKIALDH